MKMPAIELDETSPDRERIFCEVLQLAFAAHWKFHVCSGHAHTLGGDSEFRSFEHAQVTRGP